jgi:hypothetical protein
VDQGTVAWVRRSFESGDRIRHCSKTKDFCGGLNKLEPQAGPADQGGDEEGGQAVKVRGYHCVCKAYSFIFMLIHRTRKIIGIMVMGYIRGIWIQVGEWKWLVNTYMILSWRP